MAIDAGFFSRACGLCLVLLMLSGAVLPAQAGGEGDALTPLQSVTPPISTQNWLNHPAITEIRQLFAQTEDGIKTRVLAKLPVRDDSVAAWGLDAGHVRKSSQELGGEDSAAVVDRYYDQLGTLRFAFVRANAVNGSRSEYRIYFDRQGRRIWFDRRQAAGPGYPFPADFGDDWLKSDPLAAFSGD
jgi:hypothetical protein